MTFSNIQILLQFEVRTESDIEYFAQFIHPIDQVEMSLSMNPYFKPTDMVHFVLSHYHIYFVFLAYLPNFGIACYKCEDIINIGSVLGSARHTNQNKVHFSLYRKCFKYIIDKSEKP